MTERDEQELEWFRHFASKIEPDSPVKLDKRFMAQPFLGRRYIITEYDSRSVNG